MIIIFMYSFLNDNNKKEFMQRLIVNDITEFLKVYSKYYDDVPELYLNLQGQVMISLSRFVKVNF